MNETPEPNNQKIDMGTYLGAKMVQAWPMPYEQHCKLLGVGCYAHEEGILGYHVKHPSGRISWLPKDVFEDAYLRIGGPGQNKITEAVAQDFFAACNASSVIAPGQYDAKTTVMVATDKVGFVHVASSSCVDPVNYDEDVGAALCHERILDDIRKQLGFVLQWAQHGLTPAKETADK